ncbi:MAG: DUF2723 domain-containing protein, partial [Endomicrobia bacterium]|nr:DUF2723 domain-containing protein [Endomicrobiia bacterium]
MILYILTILLIIPLIYCLSPTVTVGDVAELVGAASTLGIAHSPGYPLFCNLYKIGIDFLFFGDYGYRAGVVSLVLYLVSAMLISLIVKKLTQNNTLSLFSFIYFLSQNTLLKQSFIGEVFALHNFIFIILFYFLSSPDIIFNKKLLLISFFAGLGLGNQHIIVFVYPGILLWLIYKISVEHHKLDIKSIAICVVFFLLGLTIYLYIPLRAANLPLYNWEEPTTFDRFLYLFFRGRYGTLSLAQGGKIEFNFNNLYNGLKIFLHIIGVYNTILLLLSFSFLVLTKKHTGINPILFFCIITLFLSGPFFISITGIKNITSENIYILERLITTSVICIILLVSLSFSTVRLKFLLIILTLFNLYTLCKNILENYQRKNFFLYDYTVNIFRNTPYNCILFSDRADETEFSIAYFQRLLNKRKDVKFIDCNASVTPSIYGDKYYKIWGQPRLQIRTNVEKKIIQHTKLQVYYNTVLPQQTDIPKFKFGLLYSINTPHRIIYDEIF